MIYPFINMNGKTVEAVPYYASVFKLEPAHILTFGQVENPGFAIPSDFDAKAMFSFLDIDGTRVMFCDHYPGLPTSDGASISLNIITSRENIDAWFPLLAKDGQIGLSLRKALWSKYYGSLIDKFGIYWQFSINEE